MAAEREERQARLQQQQKDADQRRGVELMEKFTQMCPEQRRDAIDFARVMGMGAGRGGQLQLTDK